MTPNHNHSHSTIQYSIHSKSISIFLGLQYSIFNSQFQSNHNQFQYSILYPIINLIIDFNIQYLFSMCTHSTQFNIVHPITQYNHLMSQSIQFQ
ncbi:hypothetical protein M0811_06158 [Anaeramoeba ignava]|uniref:Uncharacterized protein n=1 Tax=Anaeramoeba ignava TaxID=1746090 RepID=A0A9Q0LPG7_ANAIG|nr:hypothetical protein M0811_06158 [Anaeramoeba ignava]